MTRVALFNILLLLSAAAWADARSLRVMTEIEWPNDEFFTSSYLSAEVLRLINCDIHAGAIYFIGSNALYSCLDKAETMDSLCRGQNQISTVSIGILPQWRRTRFGSVREISGLIGFDLENNRLTIDSRD